MPADDFIDRIETKDVPLHNGMNALVDADDHRWLMLFKWRAFSRGRSWYCHAYIPAMGMEVGMHRIVAQAGPDQLIDHRNGNGLDNRRCNLRVATRSQNAANRPGHGKSSRFKGVSWDRRNRGWRASVMRDRKPINLGIFDTEEEAAAAYDVAAKEVWGEFAWTNFVELGDPVSQVLRRKPGRKSRPWYRTDRDAWYATLGGRQYLLVRGKDGEAEATRQFDRLRLALAREAERGRGHAPGIGPVSER